MIGGGLGGFAPGEWTDDTAQTWAVADVAATGADLRSEAALDAIARRFADWYAGGPPDLGVQTAAVLRAAGPAPTAATMAAAAEQHHERTGRSGGNGSLMRTSAVALAHLGDAAAIVEAASAVSRLTHTDARAAEACVLWCLAIDHAVRTGELNARAGLARLPANARLFWQDRLDEAEQRPPTTPTAMSSRRCRPRGRPYTTPPCRSGSHVATWPTPWTCAFASVTTPTRWPPSRGRCWAPGGEPARSPRSGACGCTAGRAARLISSRTWPC